MGLLSGYVYIKDWDKVYMAKRPPKETKKKKWSSVKSLFYCDYAIDKKVKFLEHKRFYSVRQGLVENVPWEETDLYKQAEERVKNGFRVWNIDNINDLKSRFYFDIPRLYSSMKENGFLSQEEIIKSAKRESIPNTSSKTRVGHNIIIGFDCNHDIFLVDGSHRLSICALLNINRIRVDVVFAPSDLSRIEFFESIAKR